MKTHASFALKALALTLLAAGAGCLPEMDPASKIERARVLGARVEVTGDPGRASLQPGDTATVSWLVTAPGEMPPLAWVFIVGDVHAPLAVVQGEGPPRFDVAVPEGFTARKLTLTGQICAGGQPVLDASTMAPSCTAGVGTTATVDVAVEPEWPNRNPDLASRPLWFAGAEWPVETDGCEGLPRVAAGSKKHVIRLRTAGTDREHYRTMRGDPPGPVTERETLQISQFATAGELERVFSFVEGSDQRAETDVEVKWTAPAADEVPAGGMRVRFLLVARDLRGGVDWVERSVCVEK